MVGETNFRNRTVGRVISGQRLAVRNAQKMRVAKQGADAHAFMQQ